MRRESQMADPAAELSRLNVFIGRWLTEGETMPPGGAAPESIVASDIYQWAPGGHFVVHPAYGRVGSMEVGGLEVIGYDPPTGQFHTHFFDSDGGVSQQALSVVDGAWIWLGSRTRCRGV